jgi:hypothetical protein
VHHSRTARPLSAAAAAAPDAADMLSTVRGGGDTRVTGWQCRRHDAPCGGAFKCTD